MVGRVRFFTKSAFACILISTVIVSSIIYLMMPGKPGANAANFNFLQSAWDAVADASSYAKHPDNQSGWTKFSAKDEGVSTGNNISMNGPAGSWVQTSADDFNTTGATFDGIQTSGSGSGASLVPGGPFIGPDSNVYQYRKPITIQNNVATGYTGYQVRLSIDTATLIAAGKMQGDCDDMRFTQTDSVRTNIPYWLESGCNTSSTIVWIKTDLAASISRDILFYYGNGSVSTASDGVSVFDFFDDFNGSTLDSGKWATAGAGSTTVSGGAVTVTSTSGGYWIAGTTGFGTNMAVRVRLKTAHTTTYPEHAGFATPAASTGLMAFYSDSTAPLSNIYTSRSSSNHTDSAFPIAWTANTYAVQDFIRNSTTSAIFLLNDANPVTITTNIYTAADCKPMLYGANAGGIASVAGRFQAVLFYTCLIVEAPFAGNGFKPASVCKGARNRAFSLEPEAPAAENIFSKITIRDIIIKIAASHGEGERLSIVQVYFISR